MTLGRKHMAISLACVGASLLYNVWVFTRPSTVRAASAQSAGTPQQPSSVEPLLAAAPAPHVTGDAPIDPLTIPAAPDVAIDRQPVWPRDPFAATALRQPEATAAPSPESPAEVVVASILYSPQRRLAVVNGRVVGQGDRVGDVTIVDVQPNAVVVETVGGARRTVELRQGHPKEGSDR